MSDITVQTYTDFEATATSSKSSKGNKLRLLEDKKIYIHDEIQMSHFEIVAERFLKPDFSGTRNQPKNGLKKST